MPSRSVCATVGADAALSSRQDRLTGEHAEGQRGRSATEMAVCRVKNPCWPADLLLLARYGSGRAAPLPVHRRRRLRRHRPLRHVRRHAFGGRAHQRSSQAGAELSALVEDARALALAEERVDKAARPTRAAGASCEQLGDAMGITRQAAQQRFGAADSTEDRRDP